MKTDKYKIQTNKNKMKTKKNKMKTHKYKMETHEHKIGLSCINTGKVWELTFLNCFNL